MRMISKAVLAGVAALALGGTAMATAPETKVIRVTYPDGSVQHIRYSGNVAPRVTLRQVGSPAGSEVTANGTTLVVVPARRPVAPFSLIRQDIAARMMHFDRVVAAMDRRMDAMMRQAARLAAQQPDGHAGIRLVGGERLPPGTVSYSFVSTTSGDKHCSRSVRVVSTGADQPPKVERTSSGDCAALSTGADGRAHDGHEPKQAVGDFRKTI